MVGLRRVHVIYSGTVQGVGFRFTTQRIARTLDLSGFVRNQGDGTVEAVCEGEEPQLEAFLAAVRKSMCGYITNEEISWGPSQGTYTAFDITF